MFSMNEEDQVETNMHIWTNLFVQWLSYSYHFLYWFSISEKPAWMWRFFGGILYFQMSCSHNNKFCNQGTNRTITITLFRFKPIWREIEWVVPPGFDMQTSAHQLPHPACQATHVYVHLCIRTWLIVENTMKQIIVWISSYTIASSYFLEGSK